MPSKPKTRIPPCPFCGVVYVDACVGKGTSFNSALLRAHQSPPGMSLEELGYVFRTREWRFTITHPNLQVCETPYVANDSKKAKLFYAYQNALQKEAKSART